MESQTSLLESDSIMKLGPNNLKCFLSPPQSSKSFKKLKFPGTTETNASFKDIFMAKPCKPHRRGLKLYKSRKVKNYLSKELSNEILFPNWYSKESPRPPKTRDFNSKKNGYATHCYICNNGVKPLALRCHLYFGHVKCEDCGKIFTSCLKFNNPSYNSFRKYGSCLHVGLDWVFPPVDNLKRLWNEDEETFDNSLILYLKSLAKLKSIEPFKKAFSYCNNYLETRKSYSGNQTQMVYSELEESHLGSTDFTDSVHYLDNTVTTNKTTTVGTCSTTCTASFETKLDCITTTNTTTVGACSPTSSEANLDYENISEEKLSESSKNQHILPENEFYLLSKNVIEECPNCYELFDPQNLTFNSTNWLVSVTCQNCSLLVSFVLDPPDGSLPKLKIINAI